MWCCRKQHVWQITIDFSPKGGPKDFVGYWDADGIKIVPSHGYLLKGEQVAEGLLILSLLTTRTASRAEGRAPRASIDVFAYTRERKSVPCIIGYRVFNYERYTRHSCRERGK